MKLTLNATYRSKSEISGTVQSRSVGDAAWDTIHNLNAIFGALAAK